MKHHLSKKLLIILALAALLLAPASTANAAGKKSKALKAYKTFLSKSAAAWGGSSGTSVALRKCKFALAYIDKDSVPELILYSGSNSHADGYYALYTYKNGRVTYVNNLMDGFAYYKKKGLYCSIHSGTGGYETYYHKLSSGKTAYKLYSQDETTINWDLNRDGKITVNYRKVTKAKTPMYTSTTKAITKSAFQKQLKKLVGSTKKTTIKKYYSNTASNRKKYLK